MEEENTYRTLVSSHVDCVYKNCFAKDEDELCWKGTFDNSATNAAVIDLMLRGELDESVEICMGMMESCCASHLSSPMKIF